MRMAKLMAASVVLLAALAGRAGDSAPLTIDLRNEPVVDSVAVSWNAAWVGGDAGATVVIADNGTEIRRTTGAGIFTYTPPAIGRHELTYTTYIGGVVQDEVYSAIVFKDWKYEVRDGCAVIVDTTHKTDGVVAPFSIDGYPVMSTVSETGISFGDTYRYHNTDWDNGGYLERDLKKSNYVRVFADGADDHTHIALLEVLGASSKEMINPVVENLGFTGTLTASVWTDEELRNAVLPPLSTAGEWESGGCSIDDRDPDDISGPCNFSHYPDSVYEYESDDGEFNWPQDLWPDNKAVAGRFWVSVECKASEVGRWGGIDGGFRVWHSGTGVKSEQMYVTYKTEGSWPCITNLPSLFRGLPLTNSDRYGFDIDIWDVIHIAYGVPLHSFWLESAPERPGAPLEITLPEAGILYMTAHEGDLEEIDVENADSVERKSISWNQYAAMGGEQYFYEYSSDYNNRSVLAAKVDSGRTIRLVQEDEFEDYDFNRFQFFPSSSKAVAVEASFVSIFDKNRYPRQSGNNVGDYLQGYVTGTGVYKVGETVAVTAVPAPGEAFDHWELKYGNFPSGIDTTKPVLNFVVTDACAGTAEERKQMVVRAVWKAKRQIVATTDNVSGGIASGSGFYHDGSFVTLTAQPAAGFEFVEWSDGVKTATRTVSVEGDAEYTARFVALQTRPVEDVLGGAWVVDAEGDALAEGRLDETADGGYSVLFTAADDSAAWVETVVTNACRVTFDWKSSCEGLVKGRPFDYFAFSVDGARLGFICGETDWTNETFYVTGDGEHILRWTFLRDEDGGAGENRAWLANVIATPMLAIAFAGGGATEGAVPEAMAAYAGDSVALPEKGSLAWPKHTFLGWSDGAAIHGAGTEYVVTSNAILTAQWRRNELAAPVITAPTTYEAESCTVTISAEDGVEIFYTIDGSEPSPESMRYQGPFTIAGSATVKAIAVRDDYFDSAVASATVTRQTWTFGEYANWPEQSFTTGGDAEWTRVKGVSADGYALRSGAISHSQVSRLETVVYGPGTIAFSCKVAGEVVKKQVWDGLAFCIDGVQQGDLMGNEGWERKSFEVVGDGPHTLSWLYVKDEEGDGGGEDCAWIDNVAWSPASSSEGSSAPFVDGDPDAIVAGDAGSGYTVTPSEGNKAVVVAIPQGVDANNVTVEVSAAVESVKPNGAAIKVIGNGGIDITGLLDIPAANASGVVDMTKAAVKKAVADEALDRTKNAKISLNPSAPTIETSNTRPGLKYTFVEGRTVKGLAPTEQYKWGDGTPFRPSPTVKGGESGFYTIQVGK